MPCILNLLGAQNLKPSDDGSKDSDNDNKFYTFAEELDSNWCDLIVYDNTFSSLDFYHYLLLTEKTFLKTLVCKQGHMHNQ